MACAGIPWLLYQKNRKLKEIEKHPLIDLLANPNPIMGQAKFIENVIAYLQLSGNSYIERVGPNNGPPKELYTLRPDRMVVVVGNITQPIAGYEYTANGMKTTLSNESILHLKTFHPLDDWYGMSPIEEAARTIDQNNEAKAWSVALLQNGARPSGALITPGNLSDEQFYRTENQLNTKYGGAKNAGKPMLLEGGLDWKEMSLSPVDMSWLEGQKLSSREIAIAFGVPPELIGDSSNKTYSNYREARQAFYTETILPLMDWLRDDLNRWLTPLFGDNLYLDYDRDEIEALQEDMQSVWDRSISAGLLGGECWTSNHQLWDHGREYP
jgi:HK97 family phage portal protein